MTRFFPQMIIRRSRPSVVALLSNGNHQSRWFRREPENLERAFHQIPAVTSNVPGVKRRWGCVSKPLLSPFLFTSATHLPSSISGHVQYLVCAREPPSPNSTPALWFLTRRWWELPSRVRERWSKHPLACLSLRHMCCSSFFLIRTKPWSNYKVILHTFFLFNIKELMCTLMDGPIVARVINLGI